MLHHADWSLAFGVIAAAFGEETGTSWQSRISTLGIGLMAGGALYTGSSARLGMIAVGWSLATTIAGGGNPLPLLLLLLAGYAYASLPVVLLVGMGVVAMAGLRQPVGWAAAVVVAAHLELSPTS